MCEVEKSNIHSYGAPASISAVTNGIRQFERKLKRGSIWGRGQVVAHSFYAQGSIGGSGTSAISGTSTSSISGTSTSEKNKKAISGTSTNTKNKKASSPKMTMLF